MFDPSNTITYEITDPYLATLFTIGETGSFSTSPDFYEKKPNPKNNLFEVPVRLEDSHGNIEQIKVVVQFNEKRLSKNSCPKISKKALCDFMRINFKPVKIE